MSTPADREPPSQQDRPKPSARAETGAERRDPPTAPPNTPSPPGTPAPPGIDDARTPDRGEDEATQMMVPPTQGRPAERPGAEGTAPTRRVPRPSRPSPGARPHRRIVRRRTTVAKVDPWTVLKLSLIFYFCALAIVMLGLMVFWAAVTRIGVVDRILGFLADLQFAVTIDGGMIARAIFLVGLLNGILFSGINVFLAFLYNLVSDLVGGLRVTLMEDEEPRPVAKP
jgi:hypothetical protein